MAEKKFDPYHAWLGIPKWDQPPDAYRLLGVEVFESNRKVIEAAANRQMAYLQELSAGDEHIDEAQKLLGQISRARVVLLNPEKKKAYDKKLNAKLDSLSAADTESSSTATVTTRTSATVTQAKKEKGMNRATVIRSTLLAFAGLLAIIVVLLLRSKPLVIQAYEDKNKNKMLDAGEELKGVGVVKVRIDPQKSGGGELDQHSYITDGSGEVKYNDLPEGATGFTVDPPFELMKKGNLYIKVDVESGPRFFAQRVQISVRKKPSPAALATIEQQSTSAKAAPKASKSQSSANTRIKLRGHVFARNAEGEEEPWETYLYLDLDGNGIYDNGAEPWLNSNAEGKYERTYPRKALQSQTVLRLMKSPQFYQDPGAIPLSLAEAKDGVLEIVIELKRKPISVEGTLRVLPEGESAEGFIVYMDLNENAQPDENEPQTKTDSEGKYGWEFPHPDEPNPKLIKIQASEEAYHLPRWQRGKIKPNKSTIAIQGANFELTKKAAPAENATAKKTELAGDGATGDDSDADRSTESGEQETNENEATASVLPTAESNPAGFLQNLGLEGDVPTEGSETKPVWTFQTDPKLIQNYTDAKRAYQKAEKKGGWNKIPELKAEKQFIDSQIQKIMAGAKSQTAKKAAIQRADPWNKKNEKLDAELSQLNESRDALLTPLVLAAQSIQEEQQMYEYSLEKKPEASEAAKQLGVEVAWLTKKQANAWQPALKFLAEDRLRSLGLQKKGKKWIPIGVAQESATLAQIKQFALRKLGQYMAMKKQLNMLINQNATANQSQIKRLEQEIATHTNFQSYKDSKKELVLGITRYTELLGSLETQRQELEEKKAEIEKAIVLLGGKYDQVIKQYPDAETIEKKQTFITNLQSLIE